MTIICSSLQFLQSFMEFKIIYLNFNLINLVQKFRCFLDVQLHYSQMEEAGACMLAPQDATYCSNDKDPIVRGTAIQNWAKKGKKVQKSTIKKCSKVVISGPEMVRSDREIALWLRWTDMCDRVNCLSSINCFVFFKKSCQLTPD